MFPYLLYVGIPVAGFFLYYSGILKKKNNQKSPFSLDFVKPVADLVTDHTLRNKVLKQSKYLLHTCTLIKNILNMHVYICEDDSLKFVNAFLFNSCLFQCV